MNRESDQVNGLAVAARCVGVLLLLLCGSCARPPVEHKEDALAGLTLKLSGDPTLICPQEDQCTAVRVNFSLAGSGDTKFLPLTQGDVSVSVDELAQYIPVDNLRLTNGDPSGIVINVDVSGSMTAAGDGGGTTKMQAANQALKYFIEHLDAGDRVGLLTFSSDVWLYLPPNDAQGNLPTELEPNLELAAQTAFALESNNGTTALYKAMEVAIGIAAHTGARNVLIVTDGVDTVEFNQLSPASSAEERQSRNAAIIERERTITAAAREGGIRVFTVGIGDLSEPYALNWVDMESLNRVSAATGAGRAGEIDVDRVRQASGTIAQELHQILALVRESLHADYELIIPLREGFSDRGRADVSVDVTATPTGGTQPVTLRLVFSATPSGTKWRVFIPTPAAAASASYWTIYAAMLAVLALSSGVPVVIRAARKRRAAAIADSAVIRLESHSPHVGKFCPNEARIGTSQLAFRSGEFAVQCPACNTPHHITCWVQSAHRCWRCQRELRLTDAAIAHQDD